MSDALNSVTSGLSDFGGNILKGDLGGVGGDLSKFAGTVAGLPGQAVGGIENLFGMGQQPPTSVTAGGAPTTNVGAGAANGGVGAVGPSAVSAGTSAAGAASADPSLLNIASNQPPPVDSALAGVANDGAGAAGTLAPGQPVVGAAGVDPLKQATAAAAAKPNDPLGNLVKTITSPNALKYEVPGLLYGASAINAMQPTSAEKAIKAELANAKGQQTLAQNQYNAEQSGIVPQALQQGMDLKEAQAEAAVRQRYAQMGMSGSSAEAADIAAAKTDAALQVFQEAQTMAQQTAQLLGGYDTEVSNYLTSLFNSETSRDSALRNALTGFFAATSGAPVAAAAGKS